MLPGVPQFMRQQLQHVGELLQGQGISRCARQIRFSIHEPAIAASISKSASRFPEVQIGSYPYFNGKEYKTIVTLESPKAAQVKEAQEFLLGQTPEGSVLSIQEHTKLPPGFDKDKAK
mmetsp:Transcript_3046/g.4933  ORF Transcript_3046/g.4933 Transcript_3046/m.4933 type:complete len:118 (+) Transcript_3046:277-630(+)